MENASKALLIAAAVLIAILVITIGIKILSSSSDTGKVATDTGKTISDKTGEATGLAISGIKGKSASNAINYGSKTKETIEPGDDITIGGTEKFKVFSVGTDGIKAMPYYNLKLDSNPIKQATEETASSAGGVWFSNKYYWSYDENNNLIDGWNANSKDGYSIDVDMTNPANNIQGYISSYKETLRNLAAEGIIVRAPTLYELRTANREQKNPSKTGYFWLGSARISHPLAIWYIEPGSSATSDWNVSKGVRPIIIIQKK